MRCPTCGSSAEGSGFSVGDVTMCPHCAVLLVVAHGEKTASDFLRRLAEVEWDGLPPATRIDLMQRRDKIFKPEVMRFRGDWRCLRPEQKLSSCEEVVV